ncbi:hypothetical protein GDO81_016980 [Engystomops pustulosus]|uniref:Uncharacterized protein n=1 Tax=Engystomops pustulosus TaxID=76066 RepID=A0AAV7AFZ6_ENGPU|nr:hypothetical protein GDO81_016980 [Engystomops pustulosus]
MMIPLVLEDAECIHRQTRSQGQARGQDRQHRIRVGDIAVGQDRQHRSEVRNGIKVTTGNQDKSTGQRTQLSLSHRSTKIWQGTQEGTGIYQDEMPSSHHPPNDGMP